MDNFDLKLYLKNNPLLTEGIDLPSTYGPEREKEYEKVLQRQIQDYIEGGSEGHLNLYNTPITSLPDNLTRVGGDLYLEDTLITSLPDNLEVSGYLSLNNTQITSLPNNLKVGGDLYLNNTPIASLPDNLEVGRDLWLSNTPLSQKYTRKEIRKMIEDKGGYVKEGIYL